MSALFSKEKGNRVAPDPIQASAVPIERKEVENAPKEEEKKPAEGEQEKEMSRGDRLKEVLRSIQKDFLLYILFVTVFSIGEPFWVRTLHLVIRSGFVIRLRHLGLLRSGLPPSRLQTEERAP